MAVRTLVVIACAALASTGCSDDCGDGEYHDAEICFNEHVLEVQSEAASPLALRAADFDGDGVDDVLVVGAAAGTITTDLRRGDGEGGLGEPRDVGVAGCSAYPVVGDLDLDGAADLLFPSCDAGVFVYRADGAGGFAPAVEVDVGLKIRTTAVTDVDGDGRRDLLVLGSLSEQPAVGLVRADASGGFFAPQVQPVAVPGLDGLKPGGFVAGRLRRDGPVELVLAEWERSDGLARATVEAGVVGPFVAMTTGLRPGGLYLRDLDDDDILDVLVLDTAPVALAPLLGPDLSEGPRTALGSRPGPIALAHLDGDGSLDAVLFHGDRLGLWRGVGDGRFTAAVQLEFPADVVEVVLPDLNADGRADIVAGLFSAGGLAIRLSGP
ncbi:Repeat domain-containing protein [Nannocystis exedens]|uniref:Repeat domain-containing protein n=1 Tax=Nannocystis exedens TaxID=54 RepID=A0A1I1WFH8_9BACT|nr:VCBS repeat-containing protein [Nannocystis exedens]PCC67675.1 FG-GAP repeat protein [Nannocystis exedens]SFD93822.1 Repeat domain-containing protein [Nannocystis exedens]